MPHRDSFACGGSPAHRVRGQTRPKRQSPLDNLLTASISCVNQLVYLRPSPHPIQSSGDIFRSSLAAASSIQRSGVFHTEDPNRDQKPSTTDVARIKKMPLPLTRQMLSSRLFSLMKASTSSLLAGSTLKLLPTRCFTRREKLAMCHCQCILPCGLRTWGLRRWASFSCHRTWVKHGSVVKRSKDHLKWESKVQLSNNLINQKFKK